jgi:hypothetical protein
VALVFVALLVVGFALGVAVYQKYVAYQPTAAQHVPVDATVAARIDLTHVMLYAPFRTSIMPLADQGDSAAAGRGKRLAAHGVRLGADVRELMVALGPASGDWILVVGGQLPRTGLADTVRTVLQEEARVVEARPSGCYFLAPNGPWFGQAADGAFALASSETRLLAALPTRPGDAALAEAAGGLFLSQAWLGGPFRSLRANLRAGSVVAADVHADFTDPASGAAALRALLDSLAKLDPTLTVPTQSAEIHATGTGATFRLNLPREAVERVASLTAERVSDRFSRASN